MVKKIVGVLSLTLVMSSSAFSQQAAPESTKFRKILTPVGAGGGFMGGVLLGLAMFGFNSDAGVWTTAIAGAGGGGVAGYFIGRGMDRKRSRITGISLPLGGREVELSPLLTSNGGKGFRLAISSDR